MAAQRPPIMAKYIASGTEGCVVGPALPNLSENGSRWEEYPDYVTKLYKEEEQYNKAIENSKQIKSLLHNNSHSVYPYRVQDYMGSNIKTSVTEQNGSTVLTRSKCGLQKTNELRPLRMKNLGLSIKDASRLSGEKLDSLKAIPFETILDEILKIYKQIQSLFVNGYIHGDVRETNVMIHPTTGKITLIDFGWLYPIDEFFENYDEALGFYSNPPESLIRDYFNWSIESLDEDLSASITGGKIKNYLTYSRAAGNTINYADLILMLKRHLTKTLKSYYALMAPSFDCYGLSFTIHLLLKTLYESRDTITKMGIPYSGGELELISTTLRVLDTDVIKKCIEIDVEKRIDIHEACKRLEFIVNSFHDSMIGVRGGARRRKTMKRRQNRKKTQRRK